MSGEREPLTLYCVPHAGGSARSFVRWRRELPPALVARPLEIAGKGVRSREPRAATLREAAEDLARQIDPAGRYALFGHSMGGLLAHETALALAGLGRPAPAYVVTAATRPPHLLADSPYAALLDAADDDALLAALAAHGRIPAEILASPMRHRFVPVIRADLTLLAGHRPTVRPRPLPCDLLTWYGADDPETPPEVMAEWRPYTAAAHRVVGFDGGHFFPHERFELVTEELLALATTTAATP
ncbi:thioesterase II family protein [Streptomyces sp. NPDC086091]|uniref:thioesterase II family protein n=1 Tax=Streptomyces sp. NPDC086091 TaxID=3365751 RepID=UPI0037F8CE52